MAGIFKYQESFKYKKSLNIKHLCMPLLLVPIAIAAGICQIKGFFREAANVQFG
jgi:hypothetical protein